MKSLCFAAALALIFHGLLFSLKADWSAHVPVMPHEQKSLSISMGYRTLREPVIKSVSNPPSEKSVQPEKKQQQPVTPKKRIPPPAEKKAVIRPKTAPAKTPVLPPNDEPTPEDLSDTPANPPPVEPPDKYLAGLSGPVIDEQPPGNNHSGSQGIFEKNESPGLNKPQPIVYPKAYQYNPLPEYPRLAKRRGYEGVVTLGVFVSQKGRVLKIRILKSSGYQVLDEEAKRAVSTYRFEPGSKDGENKDMWVNIPIRFQLE